MSNRKYAAALLEESPCTEKERMDSALQIISERVEKATEEILKEPEFNIEDKPVREGMQDFANGLLEKIAPELAKKYEIFVGSVLDYKTQKHKIVVAYRNKRVYEPMWNFNTDSIRVQAIDWAVDTTHIDATRITAGAINAEHIHGRDMGSTGISRILLNNEEVREIQSLRVTERFGIGVLGTQAPLVRLRADANE